MKTFCFLGDQSEKMKNQIKQMMDVSRVQSFPRIPSVPVILIMPHFKNSIFCTLQTQTAISVVEEDLKLLQFKLRASMSTKCNLEGRWPNTGKKQNCIGERQSGFPLSCFSPLFTPSPQQVLQSLCTQTNLRCFPVYRPNKQIRR